MLLPDKHYLIVRYLKTPGVDLGTDQIPSPKIVRMTSRDLRICKDKSLNSVCVDGIKEPESLPALWDLMADGANLISANPLPEDGLKLLRKEAKYQVIEHHPFHVIRKLSGTGGEVPYKRPSPAPGQKTICMVRYGAFGDHVQMTGVIEHFHREGWWIVYNTNRRGREVFRGDPRINDWIDHEDNIVSPERTEINKYWDSLAKHYDKFVCFSEVVEGTLLRIEGKQEYDDPWEKRHADCNRNYFDEHFVRAGLPEIKGSTSVIWLSDKEREWARGEVELARRKTGKSFIVLWNLMGSSFHKMYPWAYDVWGLCLQNRDDIGFITVSDKAGAYLEEGKYGNVLPRAGKYAIRNTLALHSAVDGVVSTETMSLNAGLGFPAPVIGLLSHSSPEQFPFRERDIPLVAPLKDCPCTPCHQLHYSRNGCPRGVYCKDATLCMDSITPAMVYDALMKIRGVQNGDLPNDAA